MAIQIRSFSDEEHYGDDIYAVTLDHFFATVNIFRTLHKMDERKPLAFNVRICDEDLKDRTNELLCEIEEHLETEREAWHE